MTSRSQRRGTAYSDRKPRGLGAPVSPAAMMSGVVVKDRRADGVVARRMGRVSADCMMARWRGRSQWSQV